jgi:PTS system nitrogen regulatory IIA component
MRSVDMLPNVVSGSLRDVRCGHARWRRRSLRRKYLLHGIYATSAGFVIYLPDASYVDRVAVSMNSRILDFLAGMEVMLELDVATRKQALEVISMRMASANGLKFETVFHALWRREQAASTAIGHGVALPHARVDGIDQPMLLLARTRQPIPFGAPDRKPVSILLAIVVPEHANDDHLQILAFVAERFSSDALRARLQAATSATVVKQLFG